MVKDQENQNQVDSNEQTEDSVTQNTIGDRSVFHPNIWADEFSQFGITPDMPTSEAKTLARKAMGLPERHTEGGLRTSLKDAAKGASAEQVQRAIAALQEQGADDGDADVAYVDDADADAESGAGE